MLRTAGRVPMLYMPGCRAVSRSLVPASYHIYRRPRNEGGVGELIIARGIVFLFSEVEAVGDTVLKVRLSP